MANHYHELNKCGDHLLLYLIDSVYPCTDDILDYICTGFIILSTRQHKDYSRHIIETFIDYLDNNKEMNNEPI